MNSASTSSIRNNCHSSANYVYVFIVHYASVFCIFVCEGESNPTTNSLYVQLLRRAFVAVFGSTNHKKRTRAGMRCDAIRFWKGYNWKSQTEGFWPQNLFTRIIVNVVQGNVYFNRFVGPGFAYQTIPYVWFRRNHLRHTFPKRALKRFSKGEKVFVLFVKKN